MSTFVFNSEEGTLIVTDFYDREDHGPMPVGNGHVCVEMNNGFNLETIQLYVGLPDEPVMKAVNLDIMSPAKLVLGTTVDDAITVHNTIRDISHTLDMKHGLFIEKYKYEDNQHIIEVENTVFVPTKYKNIVVSIQNFKKTMGGSFSLTGPAVLGTRTLNGRTHEYHDRKYTKTYDFRVQNQHKIVKSFRNESLNNSRERVIISNTVINQATIISLCIVDSVSSGDSFSENPDNIYTEILNDEVILQDHMKDQSERWKRTCRFDNLNYDRISCLAFYRMYAMGVKNPILGMHIYSLIYPERCIEILNKMKPNTIRDHAVYIRVALQTFYRTKDYNWLRIHAYPQSYKSWGKIYNELIIHWSSTVIPKVRSIRYGKDNNYMDMWLIRTALNSFLQIKRELKYVVDSKERAVMKGFDKFYKIENNNDAYAMNRPASIMSFSENISASYTPPSVTYMDDTLWGRIYDKRSLNMETKYIVESTETYRTYNLYGDYDEIYTGEELLNGSRTDEFDVTYVPFNDLSPFCTTSAEFDYVDLPQTVSVEYDPIEGVVRFYEGALVGTDYELPPEGLPNLGYQFGSNLGSYFVINSSMTYTIYIGMNMSAALIDFGTITLQNATFLKKNIGDAEIEGEIRTGLFNTKFTISGAYLSSYSILRSNYGWGVNAFVQNTSSRITQTVKLIKEPIKRVTICTVTSFNNTTQDFLMKLRTPSEDVDVYDLEHRYYLINNNYIYRLKSVSNYNTTNGISARVETIGTLNGAVYTSMEGYTNLLNQNGDNINIALMPIEEPLDPYIYMTESYAGNYWNKKYSHYQDMIINTLKWNPPREIFNKWSMLASIVRYGQANSIASSIFVSEWQALMDSYIDQNGGLTEIETSYENLVYFILEHVVGLNVRSMSGMQFSRRLKFGLFKNESPFYALLNASYA